MKWISTYLMITGAMLVLILLIVSGCKTHSPNTFSNSENYQQQLVIRSAYSPLVQPDNSIQPDSVNLQTPSDNESIYDSSFEIIETVDWEHRQSAVDEHRIRFEITHDADSVSYEITACGQTWDDIILCSDTAYFIITAFKGERTDTHRDSINLKLLNDLFVQERSEN